MSSHKIITGLDIGTSWIRIAVCERKNGQEHPHILALVKKSSNGLRRGYITNLEEVIDCLKGAIAEAEKASKLKIRHVCLGVGGATLESRQSDGGTLVARADYEVVESDIRRAVEDSQNSLPDMQNRQILHRVPIMFKLDGKRVLGTPEAMKGSKLEVRTMFVTYSKQHLKDFVAVAEEAGLIVDDIIASPLASSSVLLSKIQQASGSVLANVGSQTTSIAVFEENLPLSIHIFPIGSTDITNDIALGLRIPIEDADRIKKHEQEPEGPRRKLDEIIEARLSDIFEYIEVHLKKIGRNGLLPAGIIICGGGSGIPGIDLLAKDYFKLPARTAEPARLGGNNQTIDPSWAVAYGLCSYNYDNELENPTNSPGNRDWIKTIMRWFREFMP
ncbi:MAG: cell division protein FtsA [Candidatus Vogelbacteria bacterium]|nr:cell division protein FtsA [Candidatus Vogelbacteria bacterium]